jgi:hypothetical protein
MRKLVALGAFAAISAAASALAYQTLHDDQNLNSFKLYGGAAPDRSTGGLRVHDISVGAGLLKINGVDSLSYTVAAPGTDYLAPIGTAAGNYDRVSVAASGLVTGGAGMVVSNVTALEALSGANYRDGSRVFVQSVGADFVFFTANTTTVDHKMIASVSGMANARWIRDPMPAAGQWNQVSWFVNTSTGSDENDCVSSGTACATFAEVRRRILNRYVPIGNTQSIAITIAGNLGDQDPIAVDMLLVARNLATTVTVMGTPTTALLGTVASVTAHNYASNQADQVTITALDWTPYIGKIVRRVGTSGTTGQTSLVVATCGTGCAQMTQVSVFGGPGTAWQAGDSVEALTLPKAQGVRAGFAGTLLVGNFDFDPATTSAVVSVLGPGNAIIFASTFKGSSGGQFTDRGGGIALGGCGFSTRTFLAAGNVSVSWSLLSSVPTFTLNNSRVGRNEWQDAVLLNSTIALGEYVHVRFHSLGVYSLAAAAAAITMQDGASAAFTDVIYGTGNNGTSKAFTFLSDNHVYFSAATNIPADVGNAAVIATAAVNIAKTDLPYYRDVWGNEIQIAQNVDPTKHLAIAGGDITYVVGGPSQVTAIHESGGPTQLTIGGIANGTWTKRVGATLVGSAIVVGDVSGAVPTTRTLTAGAGMIGGGDLSGDRTFDVVANADGTMVVNANDIQVGVIQTGNVAADAITNPKLANMATQTFKGRTTAGTGDPEDLTATQATAMLNVFSSSLKGLAPSSGGGTTTFLRADGTWVAPAYADITGTPADLSGMHFVTTQAEASLSAETSLGALGNGVLQQSVSGSVSTPSAFSVGAARIPFGSGTNGQITDSASLTFSAAGLNNTLSVVSSNGTSGGLYFQNSTNSGQAVVYIDNDRGSFASYGGFLNGSSSNAIGNLFGLSRADRVFLFSDGASSQGLAVGTLTADPFTLGTNNAPRVTIASGGGVTVSSLTDGHVRSDGGLLSNATLPLDKRVMVSAGATADPVGNATFQWDTSTQVLFIGAGGSQKWANVGTFGSTNTEYVEAAWSSNEFTLASKKTGTGTVRNVNIDPGTATLALKGAVSIPTSLKYLTSTTVGQVLMATSTSGDVGYQPQTTILHAGGLENAFDGFATGVAANPGVTDNVLAISNSGSNDTIFERAANTVDVMRQFNYFVFGIEPVNWLITSTPSTTSATAIEYDSYGGTVTARVIANVTNNTLTGCTSKTYAVTHNGTSSAASVTIGCGVTTKTDSGWVAVTAGSTDSWGLKVTTSGVTTSGTVSASFTVLVR